MATSSVRDRSATSTLCHHADPNAMGAYERLLTEPVRGGATDVAREDYVEEAWRRGPGPRGRDSPERL